MEHKATCGMCGKSRQPHCGGVRVHGQGVVMVTYWVCRTCDKAKQAGK